MTTIDNVPAAVPKTINAKGLKPRFTLVLDPEHGVFCFVKLDDVLTWTSNERILFKMMNEAEARQPDGRFISEKNQRGLKGLKQLIRDGEDIAFLAFKPHALPEHYIIDFSEGLLLAANNGEWEEVKDPRATEERTGKLKMHHIAQTIDAGWLVPGLPIFVSTSPTINKMYVNDANKWKSAFFTNEVLALTLWDVRARNPDFAGIVQTRQQFEIMINAMKEIDEINGDKCAPFIRQIVRESTDEENAEVEEDAQVEYGFLIEAVKKMTGIVC